MRSKGQGRFDALDNAPLFETGSTQALAGGRWQPFSLEFSIPEEDRGRPIRPFLHFDAEGGVMPQQIALDDLRIMMRD